VSDKAHRLAVVDGSPASAPIADEFIGALSLEPGWVHLRFRIQGDRILDVPVTPAEFETVQAWLG
jgi:hypothetical protein